jgi:5-methylcytosine-specific restriction endonuclease McrA
MAVLILDSRKKPLMPCSEKRARLLLERGRARVHRMVPFTIRLVDRKVKDSVLQPIRLKLDPGSKTTGMALVREKETVADATGEILRVLTVLLLMELYHRGYGIQKSLKQRKGHRRHRRGKLRYREPRFDNRTKPQGWLPPSLQHRVDTVLAWVDRWMRLVPVTALSQELVRFDMQQMQNAEISGIEYQQGTLQGYEVREYLLEKWGRKCTYCSTENVPLEIDHIHPRSKGGSDRVSNLAIACHDCNQAKGNMDIAEFLKTDKKRYRLARKARTTRLKALESELKADRLDEKSIRAALEKESARLQQGEDSRLERILKQAAQPLSDAAAVNSTRWALFGRLKETGIPVDVASGGRTKWNRTRLGVPKAHCLDAACVGQVDEVKRWQQPVLAIKATGRGSYKRTRLTKDGFPRGYLTESKKAFGYQTGDLVKAVVTSGKKKGTYIGRVAIRASGSFNLDTGNALTQGIHQRFCTLIQRADGYGYSWTKIASTQGDAGMGQALPAALSLPGLNAGVSRATG